MGSGLLRRCMTTNGTRTRLPRANRMPLNVNGPTNSMLAALWAPMILRLISGLLEETGRSGRSIRSLNQLVYFLFYPFAGISVKTGKKIQANVWGKIKMNLQCAGVIILLLAIVFDWAALIPLASGTLYLAIAFAIVSLLTYGI